jgi:hypothetical protein
LGTARDSTRAADVDTKINYLNGVLQEAVTARIPKEYINNSVTCPLRLELCLLALYFLVKCCEQTVQTISSIDNETF